MNHEMKTTLASDLKNMRIKRGWSEAALARKADLPEQTIREYEVDPSKLTDEVSCRVHHALKRCRAPWRPPTDSEAWTSLHQVEAALNIDQKLFRDALKVLEKALTRADLSPECTGRLLLTQAAVLGELGREVRALEALQQAERCLGLGEKEPSVWLRLRLDQLYFLCQADRFCEADALLAGARELAADEANAAERLELSWLEGRISAGLGKWAEALDILQLVRAEHLAAGHLFEAGSATLDVAVVLICQGKDSKVEEIAREMEPLSLNKKLMDVSRSTLRLFRKAVERGSLKPETVRRLAMEFRKTDTRLTRPYPIPGWE
ncbi:MAG: helix-turn-helix domain-containing protein [Acidobacteriota bacterium]